MRETFEEAWRLRYGDEPVDPIGDLAPFLRHRSVRRYQDRPVEEPLVRGLVAAAQSASTSSNLQLWSTVSVQDPARREAMAKLCGDQEHVRRAPWFFAFLADHARLRTAALAAGQDPAGLDYAEFCLMAIVDTALAAERLVVAAETLGLGACYIGALRNDPPGVRALLGLPEGVFGVFGLCLGWPDPRHPAEIKPRLRQDQVWFRESYGPTDAQEYDQRMGAYYESQAMKGDATWSMRSGRRVDGHHMSGREVLKDWLERQGFWRR